MRKYILPAAIASAAVMSCMSANASEGTITFTGSLVSNTCVVTPGSTSLAVGLPTLNLSALGGATGASGLVAGNTPFSISVASCPAGVTGMTPYFENGTNTQSANLDIQTGGATNVQLQITNAVGSAIDLSKGSGAQGVATATVSTTGTSSFAVRYFSKGNPGPGLVKAVLTYSVIYN